MYTTHPVKIKKIPENKMKYATEIKLLLYVNGCVLESIKGKMDGDGSLFEYDITNSLFISFGRKLLLVITELIS